MGFDAATSVEVVAERDATQTVFANADGTSTIVMSSMPVHFLDESGVWQQVDNRIVADADGVLTNAANGWDVRFEPMRPGGGVELTSGDDDVSFVARNAAPVAPVVEPDGTSVRYVEVLPGTDLVYRVTGAGVEELMVLKSPNATPVATFDVEGAPLDEVTEGLKSAEVGIQISRPETFTAKKRPVDVAKQVFELVGDADADPDTEVIRLGLEAEWVRSRPATEFPIVVDPSVVVNTGASMLWAFGAQTNNGATYASYNDGYARVGNPYLSSSSTVRWRSVVSFPYAAYVGANVLSASLTTGESGTSGSGTQALNVYWADQWGFHYGASPRYYQTNAVNSPQLWGWNPYVTSTITSGSQTHSGNLKYLYNGWTRRSMSNGALLLTGNEGAGYTLKKFTVNLSLTVNRWPNSFNGSTSGSYLVPTLTRPAVTDPDNDALTYRYNVYNTNGTVYANTGWITASSWTAPKVPATWHNESHAVKIEATDGISFNGETHITSWNGTWTAHDRAPAAAGLSTPAAGASTHDLTPTLAANAATDPDGDTVQYRFFTCTTSACSTKTYQPSTAWRTSSPWTATPTAAIGSHGTTRYWGVETYDGELTTGTTARSLTLTNSNANAAALTAPANAATPHSLTQTFTATAATDPDGDAVQYRFFYCTTTACSTAERVYMTAWSTGTTWTKTFTFPTELWATTIKWGVETTDAYQSTPTTSSLRTLTFANSAPTISSLSPANNLVVTGTQPALSASLTDPDGDGINYRFVVTPKSGIGILAASPWANLPAPGPVPAWTLPADLVSDTDYEWKIETKDSLGATAASTPRTISSQGRLGAGSVSPTHNTGPVTVNLATGNLFYSTPFGPSVDTVGGPMAVAATYNSNDRSTLGLTGTYYTDNNNNNTPDATEIVLSRIDRLPVFNWGTRAPAESVPADNFKARWSGYIRIPNIAGTWSFAGGHDDRLTIKINNTNVYDSTSTVALDATDGFTGATPVAGIGGQIVPIQIDYTELTGDAAVGFRVSNNGIEYQVEQSWFTQDQPTLPTGWNLNINTGINAVWARADVHEDDITLISVDGEETVFELNDTATGYETPPEVDDLVTRNTDGTITVNGADGITYRFDTSGQLTDALSAADTIGAAGGRAVYDGTAPNLYVQRLEDRLDPTRRIVFHYNRVGDTCPTTPAGFTTTPAGMLCQIDYPDQTTTNLYYQNGLLARISDPGDDAPNPTPEGRAITDLAWTAGRLTSITDTAANDRINAETAGTIPLAQRIGALNLATNIAWNTTGDRPTTITLPAPAAAATRPATTISYNATNASVTQTGITGTARAVTWDQTGRSLTDTDSVGRTTTTTWAADDIDIPTAQTAAGRTTTTIHDATWHPTDTYGPAPTSACFNPTVPTPTGTCATTTPHTRTDYDHNLNGLSGTAYNTNNFTGTPTRAAMAPNAAVTYTWPGTTAPPGVTTGDNWSVRYTGTVTFPNPTPSNGLAVQTGATDNAVLFIDNNPVAATDTTPTVAAYTIAANTPVRVRIDFTAGTGNSNLAMTWTPPSAAPIVVAASIVRPGLHHPTRTTTYDSGGNAPTTITETRYNDNGIDPTLGLITAEVDDPTGLALSETYSYEPATTGSLLRRTRRTLPAFATSPTTANSTTYEYWADTATADNPCTPAIDPASQAGLLRYTQDPTPDVGSPIRTETIYDNLGRRIATRYTNEPDWTCTTYDTRGRITQTTHPADTTHPTGRTVTSTYNVGGDPYTSRISDPVGSITTTTDSLGRTISTTDVWNTTTTTAYDTAGRATTITSPAGVTTNTYDNANRLATQQLDSDTLAAITYKPDTATLDPGQLATITYPNGTANAGNGTRGNFTYNALGELIDIQWTRTNDSSLIAADTVTRSLTGRILTNSIDNNTTPTWTYTYDAPGRLTRAVGSGQDYTYNYTPTGGCGANPAAGTNTNRTSHSNNGTTIATNCYDNADRLTSTTQLGYATPITYDTHGNTLTLAGDTYTYDHANRHLATEHPNTRRITYLRDALDRIVQRTDTDLTGGPPVVLRYSYADTADTADIVYDTTGNIIETNLTLPGGVNSTARPSNPVWSYPNIHGDTLVTTNDTATKQGPTYLYDPYGNPLTTTADNQTGNIDNNWLGQHQRAYEHALGIAPTINMGARPYNPTLGRFLAVDPIPGGNETAYGYPVDPVNRYDLDGRCGFGNPFKKCGKGHRGGTNIFSGAAGRARTIYNRTLGNPSSRTNAFLCAFGAARVRVGGFTKCIPYTYRGRQLYDA